MSRTQGPIPILEIVNNDEDETVELLRNEMQYCCHKCIERRANIFDWMLEKTPLASDDGLLNILRRADEYVGSKWVALHPGTNLELHRLYYDADEMVYSMNCKSSKSTTPILIHIVLWF